MASVSGDEFRAAVPDKGSGRDRVPHVGRPSGPDLGLLAWRMLPLSTH